MAKLLLALFLVSVGFRLLADFSIVAKTDLYSQFVEDTQENQKEELEKGQKETKLTFHFIRLNSANHLLENHLKTAISHGKPSSGFVTSSFMPPEAA